jgi:hypothetical protein
LLSVVASVWDLGVVQARQLQLEWIGRSSDHRYVLTLFFQLFEVTSFPHLHTLRFVDGKDPDSSSVEESVVFDPDPRGSCINTLWTPLREPFASQLKAVHVVLPSVDVFKRASRFPSLFGVANRPGVLQVIPHTVELVD